MKKKRPFIEYTYIVRNLSKNPSDEAYEAYIPAFKSIIYGNSNKELLDGIDFAIESAIEDLKKEGRPIPIPENRSVFSGKFILRLKPELHQRISYNAKLKQKSLNSYVSDVLDKHVK